MLRSFMVASVLVVAGAVGGCGEEEGNNVGGPTQVFTVAGDKPTVTAAFDAFKVALGGPLNGTTPGTQPSGFRAVNWDATPADFVNTNTFPGTFFNTNSTRGLLVQTDGSGLRVDSSGFLDVSSVGAFPAFSGNKLFAAIGSIEMNAVFAVPGGSAPAAVHGFGVIFVGVEAAGSEVEFFDLNGRSLGKLSAPVAGADLFSFVGATFEGSVVSRVRITTGQHPVNEGDVGNADVVVLDDFAYGEPVSIF
jgi:hypothetical protein